MLPKVTMKTAQLLLPMRRVIPTVDIEHNLIRGNRVGERVTF
jgi:hypothetical protein